MTDIVIAAGPNSEAQVYGTFKALTIGRPQAVVSGRRYSRRVLRMEIVLTGADEDIERDLLALQQAVTK